MQTTQNLDDNRPFYMFSDNQLMVLLNHLGPDSQRAWEAQQELDRRTSLRNSDPISVHDDD